MTEALDYGIVQVVSEDVAGDELLADVAVGALSLPVADAVDFDEQGGQLIVDGTEVVAYSSADLDADTLQLSTPLASAYLEGTPVQVYPLVVERRALVQLDLDGEAIDARVPHALFDRIPLGTREVGERVSLALDGQEWVIADVLGQEPSIDGTFVDLSEVTFPGGTDGFPPASSPTPTVLGGVGVLHVRWPGIANADPVVYEVHLSTLSGFVPSGATLAAETPGTAITLKALPDGTALGYGTEEVPQLYYVKLVAKDEDPGTAPPSAEASGSLHRVANTEISASYAYLGTLSADAITAGDIDAAVTVSGEVKTSASGQRVVMDSQGLHLFTSAGAPLVDLPTDPTKVVSIKNVDAEVQNLSVKGNLSLETKGTVGAGAGLELVGGVLAPGSAPTVLLDHEVGGVTYTIPIPITAQGSNLSMYAEAVAFDANYAYVAVRSQSMAGTTVARCPRDGGVATHTYSALGIWGVGLDSASGKVWVGMKSDFNRTIKRLSATLTDDGQSWSLPNASGSGKVLKGLSIDNGVAYIGWVGGSSYYPAVEAINVATGAVVSVSSASAGPSGSPNVYAFGFGVGVFDFGDGVFRAVFNYSGTVVVYTLSGSTLTHRPDDGWETGTDGAISADGPVAWSSADNAFRQVQAAAAYGTTATTVSLAWKRFTGVRWTSADSPKWWASYTWRDSDAGGAAGTSETDQGLRAGFTMKPRYRLTLASAAIPDLGGADDPNAVSFYVGRGTTDPTRTGMWRQAAPADGVTSSTLTAVAFSGINPPATNDFPGSTPGYIKAGQGGAKRQDGQPKTFLDGLGAANVDGLIPPGSVQMWAGVSASPPTGWVFCNGTATPLNTATSPDLFAAIGYTYGGSGTTFYPPNFNDRMPLGAGGARAPGAVGGAETKPVPPHTHTTNLVSHTHFTGTYATNSTGSSHDHGNGSLAANTLNDRASGSGGRATATITGRTGSDGSGHTHGVTGESGGVVGTNPDMPSSQPTGSSFDVMPPWLAVKFIIKL